MTESNVVTFNIELPGARRTHELKFALGDTIEEKHGCIKVKTAVDRDENEMNVWIVLKNALEARPNAEAIRDKLNNEIGVLKLLDHRYVLKLFQVFASEDRTYVLTERCTGTLARVVSSAEGKKLPLQQACLLFNQLISAISYTHSKGLAHRNINPYTVLLDEEPNGSIKLGEFEDACLQSSRGLLDKPPDSANTDDPFLRAFIAPEVLAGGQYHGKKADVYSCTAVLFYMVTGKPPPVGAAAADDPDLTDPVREVVRMGMDETWQRVEDKGRVGVDELRAAPWVATGRRHSSTGDANPTVLNEGMLQQSRHHASGIGFTRQSVRVAPRLGGLAVNTGRGDDDDDDAGMSSPESLIDDSFSPLPKRGPKVFGDLNIPQKAATLSIETDAQEPEGFDLSPPASPSMKSKKALKLNALDGEGQDGVADDADFAASPMGKKLKQKRVLPTSAEDTVAAAATTLQADPIVRHGEATQVVQETISKVVQDNERYMKDKGLPTLMEDMLVCLLGSHPEGDEKVAQLLQWARTEQRIRQEAKQQGIDASNMSEPRRLSLIKEMK